MLRSLVTTAVPRAVSGAVSGAVSAGAALGVLLHAGLLRSYPPSVLAGLALTVRRWGFGPAAGFVAMAVRAPDGEAIVDELGSLTWAEVERRTNALARGLADRGVGEGDVVAVLARNHRGFVETAVAVAKLGADLLCLNTAFAGPQVRDVLAREGAVAIVHDEEFAPLLAPVEGLVRVLAWVDGEEPGESVEELMASASDAPLAPPGRHGRVVVLTSGTTGAPRGAARGEAGLGAAVSLLSRMPLRAGGRTHVAAPLFHSWGFAHLGLAVLLGSCVVLRRRFEPEDLLRTLEEEHCDAAAVVPVMLQRVLALPEETLARYDLAGVRVVAASGSALPGDLALDWMDRFGEHLHNVYGSTEVAWVSVATPQDLRAAPTSAGRAPWRTTVRLLGPDDREVPAGTTGRIFVANSLLFEGYSGGGGKAVVDGLMSTGDLGRLDDHARLHVEGREDDMIVSGGENVFPQEVEDCLARHDGVLEAAAVGVDDAEFGTRLHAFVVVHDPAVDAARLTDWVRHHLARYKVPREITIIDELPRTATGKILKRDLVSPGATGEGR